jgi:hypothetical protein
MSKENPSKSSQLKQITVGFGDDVSTTDIDILYCEMYDTKAGAEKDSWHNIPAMTSICKQ